MDQRMRIVILWLIVIDCQEPSKEQEIALMEIVWQESCCHPNTGSTVNKRSSGEKSVELGSGDVFVFQSVFH